MQTLGLVVGVEACPTSSNARRVRVLKGQQAEAAAHAIP